MTIKTTRSYWVDKKFLILFWVFFDLILIDSLETVKQKIENIMILCRLFRCFSWFKLTVDETSRFIQLIDNII